ncbi:hypothetical protein [Frisingicoccus sp.]|uniref:hypothetical protein n=1 Tax=Frisingicoccus sp. TaxID=1918627 RepID=UPI00399ACC04
MVKGQIECGYIHRIVGISKIVIIRNLVLEIDEYLGGDVKDKELEFLSSKKL